jgi:hypothetical protein
MTEQPVIVPVERIEVFCDPAMRRFVPHFESTGSKGTRLVTADYRAYDSMAPRIFMCGKKVIQIFRAYRVRPKDRLAMTALFDWVRRNIRHAG